MVVAAGATAPSPSFLVEGEDRIIAGWRLSSDIKTNARTRDVCKWPLPKSTLRCVSFVLCVHCHFVFYIPCTPSLSSIPFVLLSLVPIYSHPVPVSFPLSFVLLSPVPTSFHLVTGACPLSPLYLLSLCLLLQARVLCLLYHPPTPFLRL